MDLSRLRSIVHNGAVPRVAPPPRRELTYEPVGRDGLPIETRCELPSLDGASWIDTDFGRIVAIDHEYCPQFLHGRVAVEDLATWDHDSLTLLNGRPLSRNDPRRTQPRQFPPRASKHSAARRCSSISRRPV